MEQWLCAIDVGVMLEWCWSDACAFRSAQIYAQPVFVNMLSNALLGLFVLHILQES